MKKNILASLLIALAVGHAFNNAALATEKKPLTFKNQNELSIQAGALIIEGNSPIENSALMGIRYGRYLNEQISLEGSFLAGRTDIKNSAGRADVNLTSLQGLYHWGHSSLRPFVSIGAGVLKSLPDHAQAATHTNAQAGVGLKWHLNDSFVTRAETTYIYDVESSRGQNNLLASAAIGWMFKNPFACPTCPPKPEEKKEEPVKVEEVITSTEPVVEVPKLDQYVLQDVRFAFNSTKFDTKSRLHLDEMATIFFANLTLKLKIEGHTDSRGSVSYNQLLSERRALSAKSYLVEKGIEPERIETEGFGLTRPISTNLTIEGRAQNRRVEFKMIRP